MENLNLNINPLKIINMKIFQKKLNLNQIQTPRINLDRFSLILKDNKNQNRNNRISNFSEDKYFHKTMNLNSINIEKNKLNYIKNNFLKKLRPSYSMNREIESFNSDVKTLEINKSNKILNKKRINIHTKNLINEIKKNGKNINYTNRVNIKYKKIIYPINLMKKNASKISNYK